MEIQTILEGLNQPLRAFEIKPSTRHSNNINVFIAAIVLSYEVKKYQKEERLVHDKCIGIFQLIHCCLKNNTFSN